MKIQRFKGSVAAGPRGSGLIVIPFDPDQAWGAKSQHRVRGRVNGRRVRGSITPGGGGWAFTLTPMWLRDAGVAVGDEVAAELAPEGPQRDDLADDLRAALEANPAAGAFFDTLAQFYRRAYLRWIDATTRRPDVRAARIAQVVDLLAAGVKERPRLSRASGLPPPRRSPPVRLRPPVRPRPRPRPHRNRHKLPPIGRLARAGRRAAHLSRTMSADDCGNNQPSC